MTYEALREHGPFAKCNPALRSPETVECFWQYVLDGTIDTIASDHSPFQVADKEKGLDNIFKATAGMPGFETMFALTLTAINEGRLTLSQAARLHCERPAELFHLSRKGRIAPGYDADFSIVDLGEEWTFDRTKCFSKACENMRANHGRRLKGRVKATWLRGEKVYDSGEITGQAGYGRFVRPAAVK
jgi:dihydroorotase-like cyclic amidohydrolase